MYVSLVHQNEIRIEQKEEKLETSDFECCTLAQFSEGSISYIYIF